MRARVGAAVAALGLVTTGGLLAPSTAAAEPLPFLAVDCAQHVAAFKGQPVQLGRVAVVGLVTQAIRENPKLGLLRSTTVGATFPLGPAIPVGTVPDGTGEIPGSAVADAVAAVVRPLPEIAPDADAVTAAVHALVTEKRGMALRALDATEPAPQQPPPPPGHQPNPPPATSPSTQPVGGNPSAPPDFSLYDPTALAAGPHDYTTVPYARAGHYAPEPDARYGVPGYAPEFGLLGADRATFRPAGEAYALPVTPVGSVGLPVMLAVLALSAVTGALVRTWVLRRA